MRRYVIAGVELVCTFDVAGIPRSGFRDCTTEVGIGAGGEGDWYDVPGHEGAVVRGDGQCARVATADVDRPALRAIAAFAASLQGRPVIHCAGIEIDGRAVLIVGGSGVGKSTLAGALVATGAARVVDDDIVACRIVGGTAVVPTERSPLTVDALYFPERVPSGSLSASLLNGGEAMELLLRNGFGEIPDAVAWRAQFDLYAVLARQARAFRLAVPDDLDRVADAAAWVTDHVRRVRSEGHDEA